MGKALTPAYIQIVERKSDLWYFIQPSKIVSVRKVSCDSDFLVSREESYGLSKAKIALEFRLLTGAKEGYYIADMKNKKYYYCGGHWSGVKLRLLQMGIGRIDDEIRTDLV